MNPTLKQAAKTLTFQNVNLNLNVQCPVDRAVDLAMYDAVESAVYRRFSGFDPRPQTLT